MIRLDMSRTGIEKMDTKMRKAITGKAISCGIVAFFN